ncbi:MAG: parallel beta-helix domain-containing protein [Deltaproteobacteria bacterium]
MRTVGLALLLFSAACGSNSPDPCTGVTGACVGVPEGSSPEAVQQALLDVQAGGTVAFGAGTFDLTTGLSLDIDDVTLQGAGMDRSILSFAHQTDGAQGLYVTAKHGFTMHDLAVEDTKGDGVKLLGTTKVRISKSRVEWTKGANETNGSYGLYPVQCADVLLDGNVVKGASDSGVYVGQSDMIEVKNNQVSLNVAGIEIENSTHADVHDNTATANTGGILVFNLPGLQVENGAITRVFDNQVFENNTENFAPEGNIVGLVPTGTGIAILAAHQVEIFNNNIHDHKSINLGIISYETTMIAITDPNYDQYPTAISIHDNMFAGTSDTPTGPLGALLISALGEIQTTGPYIVPDIGWDGVMDPARLAANGGMYAATDRTCITNNGDADFINLAWPLADATKPSLDASQVACTLAALPAVVIQ